MDKRHMQKSTIEGIAPHFLSLAALLVFAQTVLHFAGFSMEHLLSALAAVVCATLGQVLTGCTLGHLEAFVCPIVCGLAVGCFAWMMVYMDSEVQGTNPPVPFFAEQRKRKYIHQSGGLHTNYAAAVASGLTVTLLMAWTNRERSV